MPGLLLSKVLNVLHLTSDSAQTTGNPEQVWPINPVRNHEGFHSALAVHTPHSGMRVSNFSTVLLTHTYWNFRSGRAGRQEVRIPSVSS